MHQCWEELPGTQDCSPVPKTSQHLLTRCCGEAPRSFGLKLFHSLPDANPRLPVHPARSAGTRLRPHRNPENTSGQDRTAISVTPARHSGSIRIGELSITLLTNRTWPDCSNTAIKQLRPRIHDEIVEALG